MVPHPHEYAICCGESKEVACRGEGDLNSSNFSNRRLEVYVVSEKGLNLNTEVEFTLVGLQRTLSMSSGSKVPFCAEQKAVMKGNPFPAIPEHILQAPFT